MKSILEALANNQLVTRSDKPRLGVLLMMETFQGRDDTIAKQNYHNYPKEWD